MMRSRWWIYFGLDCAMAACAAILAVSLVGAAFIAVLRADVPQIQLSAKIGQLKPPAPSLLEAAIIDAAHATGIPADSSACGWRTGGGGEGPTSFYGNYILESRRSRK